MISYDEYLLMMETIIFHENHNHFLIFFQGGKMSRIDIFDQIIIENSIRLFDFFIHNSEISTVLIKQLIATVDPNWPFYLDWTLFLKSGFRPNLNTFVEMGHGRPNQTVY